MASDPWAMFRSPETNSANLIQNDAPAITSNRAIVPSTSRAWGDAEALNAGLYEQPGQSDPWAAFREGTKNQQPTATTTNPVEERFGEMQPPSVLNDKPTGARYQTWPERLVRGIGQSILSGVTLPGDVVAGKASPYDTGRVLDAAMIASPISPGARLLSKFGASPVARPVESSNAKVRADAVSTLSDEGVTAITAGQQRGSKALKYAESTLGDATFSGGKATAMAEKAAEQYTRAVLRRAGVAGETRATPEVLSKAGDAIGESFTAVASRNPKITLDAKWGTEAGKVAEDFKNLTGQDSPLISSLIQRVSGGPRTIELPPAGTSLSREQYKALAEAQKSGGNSFISGETYQSIQSDISRMQRAASQPELKMALGDLKGALDDAIERGLKNPKDITQWQEARRQYKNLLVIEKAATGAGEEAALGFISPAKLRQAVVAQGPRAYVRGRSDFAGLARAGNAVMGQLPNSGTAQRAAAQIIPGLIAGGAAGTASGLLPGLAAVAAPGLTGRALMSRPVQAALSPRTSEASKQVLLSLMKRGIPAAQLTAAGDKLSVQEFMRILQSVQPVRAESD